MDTTVFPPVALVALIVAMLITAYELHASLTPISCNECPHCRDVAAERKARELELQTWYARTHGLDGDDDDDDRRIG